MSNRRKPEICQLILCLFLPALLLELQNGGFIKTLQYPAKNRC